VTPLGYESKTSESKRFFGPFTLLVNAGVHVLCFYAVFKHYQHTFDGSRYPYAEHMRWVIFLAICAANGVTCCHPLVVWLTGRRYSLLTGSVYVANVLLALLFWALLLGPFPF
jgi:hypothetical protein